MLNLTHEKRSTDTVTRSSYSGDALKANAIKLARQHRATCSGQSCDISLFMLLEMLLASQIPVTDDEFKEFL